MKKFILLTTIFASSISIDSHAAATKTVKLDTVTVVATRTERDVMEVPGMVTVIDTAAPGKRSASKISDLLSGTPGVEFVGGPLRSGETPTMRGFDSTSLIITLDQRKQNFESQHDGRFYIDPSLLKKVEVVKGSSSALYGSGGLGGVIAFETKDAKDFLQPGQNEGAEFTTGYQSANEEGYGILTGYKVGDNYDAVVSVVKRRSEDVALSNDTTQRSDDNVNTGFAKLTYDISQDSTIKFDINTFYNFAKENSNPSEPGIATTAGKNLVDKEIYSNQGGVKYFYDPDSNKIDLSTQLYYVDTDVNETILQASSLNPAGDVLIRNMKTYGFNADNKSIFEIEGMNENILSYGIEVYHNVQEGKDTDSDADGGVANGGRAGVPNAKSTTIGAYVQDELKFEVLGGRELYITPAIRFDHYKNEPESSALASDEESAISPKLASTLKLNKNYNIFSSYSEGFRAPNLTELYASGTHFPVFGSFVNTFVASPNLQPEESRTFELGAGAKFNDIYEKDDEIRFKASRYITDASNYIEQVISGITIGIPPCNFPFVDGSCSGGTAQFVNVAEANIWGYEGEIDYDNSRIEAKLGVSYVSGENAQTGQFLTTKQPLIVTTKLGYKVNSIDSTIGYTGKYADDNKKALVDNSDSTNPINYRRPGFATHGMYLSYEPEKYKNISLDLAVDNIFDKRYREPFAEIYSMERNYKLRFTYKF